MQANAGEEENEGRYTGKPREKNCQQIDIEEFGDYQQIYDFMLSKNRYADRLENCVSKLKLFVFIVKQKYKLINYVNYSIA